MNTYAFKVEGMHCQSCEILIKEELGELPGVSEVVVDHSTGQGTLNLDESLSTQDDVIAAIKNAGYTATLAAIQTAKKPKAFKEILITKDNPSGNIFNPIKVVHSSRFAAEGNLIGNENGILQIDGSMSSSKNTEFIIPDGKEEESIEYIQKFMQTMGSTLNSQAGAE